MWCVNDFLAPPPDFFQFLLDTQLDSVEKLKPTWWSSVTFQKFSQLFLGLPLDVLDACAGAIVVVVVVV